MMNSLCWNRARGGIAVVLTGLCLVLSARPTFAQDKGKNTAEYWKKIKAITDEENPGANASLEKKISAMHNVASRIDDLSARGVDEEAVDVGDKMVALCKRTEAFLNDYGDDNRAFASGFRDGLNKNPTRAIDEALAIKQQLEEMQETASKARKHLEARYDVDLPPLK